MKVGDTVWRFDENRRVYTKALSGKIFSGSRIIWREHWGAEKIVSENRRSWITEFRQKAPKYGPHRGWAFSQQEIDDLEWVQQHRYSVERAVGRCQDADILRQIAKMVGWEPEAAEHKAGR